jgi:cytochrome b
MLLLRLAWGLIGPDEARFSAFPPSLGAARAHLAEIRAGRHRAYRSHDPLGSLMAYALWGTLLVVVATGVAMEADPFPGSDPRAIPGQHWQDADEAEEAEMGEELLEDVHEAAANVLIVLALLHVAGVAVVARGGNRGLLRAMLRGRGPG